GGTVVCGAGPAPRHTGTMTAAADPARTVAVVGAGPRGTAIVERLVAASNGPHWRGGLTVHLIDPLVGRGGAVWRDDQPEVLLMNTTTCQTTMYPDESCHAVLPVPRAETLAEHLGREGLAPTDFASRAAHGRYLAHVLATARRDADPSRLRIVEHAAGAVDRTGPADRPERVRVSAARGLRDGAHAPYPALVLATARRDAAPSRLRIVEHAAEAVDVTGPADGPQRIRLSDGRVLRADAVALALGHLPTALGPRSQQLADAAERHGLVHIGPANPLEVDYASLLGREAVAVQGMGLNFYDAIGMLTHVAGGRFL